MREFIRIVEELSSATSVASATKMWVYPGDVPDSREGALLFPYTINGLRKACKNVQEDSPLSVCAVNGQVFNFSDNKALDVLNKRDPDLVDKLQKYSIHGHLPWSNNRSYRDLMRKFMMKFGFKGMIVIHNNDPILYVFDTSDLEVVKTEKPNHIRSLIGTAGGFGMKK